MIDYQQSEWGKLPMTKKEIDNLKKFFRAAAWYYGNIPLGKAYDIYRSYGHKITKKDFLAFVKIARKDKFERFIYVIINPSRLYCNVSSLGIWEHEIIYSQLLDYYDDNIDDCLYYKIADNKFQYDKPYKVVDEQHLYGLFYGRSADFDPLKAEVLREFLMARGFTETKINNFIKRFIRATHMNENYLDIIQRDILVKQFAKQADENDFNDFLQIIADLYNTVSLMINNGYSPKEMVEKIGHINERPGPIQVAFTKRMKKEIRSGRIDIITFSEMVKRYPEKAQKGAWEEFFRVASGQDEKIF